MARSDVAVIDGTLILSDTYTIPVGSAAWFAWLEDPAVTSVTVIVADFSYGMRKERKQRGGSYWTAHKRIDGRLRKRYLGPSRRLSPDLLRGAVRLFDADRQVPPAPAPPRPTPAGPPAPAPPPAADLLQSKLAIPGLRRNAVARPRLLAALDQVLETPLTVVQAPAGFGKTTALVEWITARPRPGGAARFAWLGLDASDNDPLQFWSYLCAALDSLLPGALLPLIEPLRVGGAGAARYVLTRVLNTLAGLPMPGVLILDDYHLISARVIHDDLDFLLQHLPPMLHLVLATRAEPPLPLARLHAQGALCLIRAGDLRFTSAEVDAFLRQTMGLALSDAAVEALDAGTEGWVTGLQLAALALRGRQAPGDAEALTTLMRRNRYLLDYLVGEVLARQPGHLQNFLLQTAVLSRMCGPLCDALLLGDAADVSTPAYSQLVLEQIERADLFLLPLDAERRWYRYHTLFAEVLRTRLQESARPEAVAALHRRAAAWYAANGLLSDAIDHALAAGDWPGAADLLERAVEPLLMQGQLSTVQGWLQALPRAVLDRHPALLVQAAVNTTYLSDIREVEGLVDTAERTLHLVESPAQAARLRGQIASVRCGIARDRGDIGRSVELARAAAAWAATQGGSWALNNAMAIEYDFHRDGEVGPQREQRILSLVAQIEAAGHIPLLAGFIAALAQLRRLQGRLRAAEAAFQLPLPTMGDREISRLHLGSPRYQAMIGSLLYEWGRLDEAALLLGAAAEAMTQARLTAALHVRLGLLTLARLQQAQGDPAAAAATLADFLALCARRGYHPALASAGHAELARLRLAQGDLEAALRWADDADLPADEPLDLPAESARLTRVRVWIAALERGRHGAGDRAHSGPQHVHAVALPLLGRMLADATEKRRAQSAIEILTVRALAHQALGDLDAALADLERALALGAPEGYLRSFADEGEPLRRLGLAALRRWEERHPGVSHLRRVLAAMGAPADPRGPDPRPTDAAPPVMVEPLTARELEVMRLLAAGASNRQIGAALVVSEGTIKKHLANIFGKLDAQSRTQAVARARAAGLLRDEPAL